MSKKSRNRKKEKEKDDSSGEERKTLVVQVNVHILMSVLKFKFNISICFWKKKMNVKKVFGVPILNKVTFSFLVKMHLLYRQYLFKKILTYHIWSAYRVPDCAIGLVRKSHSSTYI